MITFFHLDKIELRDRKRLSVQNNNAEFPRKKYLYFVFIEVLDNFKDHLRKSL